MVFTREDAARAAQNIGIDFKKEAFQLEDLLNGMNTELARHGTKAGTADVTHDDPTMTAKLAVANLRVSPSYYSQRVGKSAWERSLARGVKHKGAKTEYKTVEFELEGFDDKEGTFSGYGAVFSNIDSGGDIIEPGAFTKTIAEAARSVHRRLRQIEYRTQACDHPILWSGDENSYYLKFYIFQVVDEK